MSIRGPIILWLVASVALLLFLGVPPVQRTQEARVVEAARQMLGHGIHDWMVPHLNGQIRLQKPPLAYWMAAAGFEVGGVNDFAGRFLSTFCGIFTLVAVYSIARRWFGDRIALLGCAVLLCSYIFFRYSRLAETDSPASLFATTAVALLTAAMAREPSRRKQLLFHLAAASMALAGLAKGPPLVYPLLYLVFASIALRSNELWKWIRSGAPITLLLIVLPWYVYIIHRYSWTIFRKELSVSVEGADHGGWPWVYAPWLLMGLAPWTGFTIFGCIGLGQSLWKGASRELKLLTAWICSIAVPLTFAGNKQVHYLLPLMSPLMVMTAWWISLGLRDPAGTPARIAQWLLIFTTGGAMALAVALGFHLSRSLPSGGLFYWVVPGLMILGGMVTLVLQHRSLARGLVGLIVTAVVVLPLAMGYVAPRFIQHNPRVTAGIIRERFGEAPLAFYGPNLSLPLCYNLRQTIPWTTNPDTLRAMQSAQPNLVVIAQEKEGRVPAAPPAPFTIAGEPLVGDEQVFTFYRVP